MKKFDEESKRRIHSTQNKKTNGITPKDTFVSRVQSVVDKRIHEEKNFIITDEIVRKTQSLVAKENNGVIPKNSFVSDLQSDFAKQKQRK